MKEFKRWVGRMLSAFVLVLMPLQYSSAEIAQTPLFLGGAAGVPGNLVLTPSVEYPTIQSLANLGSYSHNTRFEGYFDPGKCYEYQYSGADHADNHFKPSSEAGNRTCQGEKEWSGNFLNWATTQTIDPFRKVLTGGYRVKDTETETWLEKARHPGQSNLTTRKITGNLVAGATPFNSDVTEVRVKISGLEKDMRFSLNGDSENENERWYNPKDTSQPKKERSYRAAVRVKVCDTSVEVEENCKQYSLSWKPEGLIQQNSERIRYSVFGYLNDDDQYRDGGVLRAAQKYVGPKMLVSGSGFEDNPNKEWNPETGVFVIDPDPDDAENTHASVTNSGVINYINKFGQLNTYKHKSHDPVSELYYAATRYLKGQDNVPEYTNLSTNVNTIKERTDGFPVIKGWKDRDPIQYECQPNVILGIGDTNTHKDKNLPGSAYSTNESGMPLLVSADTTVDVVKATNQVGQLEGIVNIGNKNPFKDNNNSAYIAGLAYDNHTMDMRPDMPGKQTASTHWVDVLENEDLKKIAENQYFLAAKYGGFKVPTGYGDPYSRTAPLLEGWWHTNDEIVGPVKSGGASFKRPDNYYIAGEAHLMIDGLRQAFRNITQELSSSVSSVAANSTSLQADTAIFQAAFDSTHWSGDLRAYELSAEGQIAESPLWSAAAKLDELTNTGVSSRNILTAAPMEENSGALLTITGSDFKWGNLHSTQQAALHKAEGGAVIDLITAQDRLAYLRGDRAEERTDSNLTSPFRRRDSRLGDIVNSTPQYVHQQNYGYYALHATSAFSSIGSYAEFRASGVYWDRPPMIVVGAGDGMFHGFDASVTGSDGGKELFAYVPAGVYDNLWELTDPNYKHRYFVDGTPQVSDVWLGSPVNKWRTIAVGTTGAGGKSVFALDVTDPENMSSNKVLWEFSHPDMGYTIQQPSIFALPSGEFGVAVSSGYDTGTTNSSIWLLNAATGKVIRKIDLPTGNYELGAPNLIDLDGDRIADRIYVGDTGGKLWRIDLDGSNPAAWTTSSGLLTGNTIKPLFTAADGQAITADLVAALNEHGEVMVFFGTGSFQRVGENVVPASPQVESFYGIVDRGEPLTRDGLLEQEILYEGTVNGNGVRLVSKNTPTGSYQGWYMDLLWKTDNGGTGANGERVVAKALVRSDRVIFPTLIPSEDPCAAGGRSWLMEVSLYSGGQLNYPIFDVNNDDTIDDSDRVLSPDDPTAEPQLPSGIDSGIGIINTPTVIEGCIDGDECKIVSGSTGQVDAVQEAENVSWGRVNWEQLR